MGKSCDAFTTTSSAQVDAFALLIARETGKTLRDARGETLRAARIFDFFAGPGMDLHGKPGSPNLAYQEIVNALKSKKTDNPRLFEQFSG